MIGKAASWLAAPRRHDAAADGCATSGLRQIRMSPQRGLPFGVDVHETTVRVNVRWVTPLGEETASTS